MPLKRCGWCGEDELYQHYHDVEWGVPCFDDAILFEFLLLEGAQAGLSWITVLRKRENYRKALSGFNAAKIARFTPAKVEKLLEDPGIIRNRLKVQSAIRNAKAYLKIQQQHGTFSDYIWQFVDGAPIQNRWKTMSQVPASTPESDAMSKQLKKDGFNFVGTTICYAYMQSMGMVNDHLVDCFRYKECKTHQENPPLGRH
ncbi:DNA-3-methyladenine glycosylase I [Ketobacter sp. MCCC 1A13808]|uniref:DNA-3-methyladenine glycosylase I n=1 Tax=Ketobacter sp. MCCC 1A13808 TaxID=2602738 RepID=UPI0012EBACF5|nr:DNA-3-methyladenine glycosylase I [Ketobacter sp. MCCC 1A13808]MVF10837.1 DNA-3-methyladenine glycosylase I [Ketobacter sp. MCCC 1A13808]